MNELGYNYLLNLRPINEIPFVCVSQKVIYMYCAIKTLGLSFY